MSNYLKHIYATKNPKSDLYLQINKDYGISFGGRAKMITNIRNIKSDSFLSFVKGLLLLKLYLQILPLFVDIKYYLYLYIIKIVGRNSSISLPIPNDISAPN